MTMMGSFWIETTTNFSAFRPFPAVQKSYRLDDKIRFSVLLLRLLDQKDITVLMEIPNEWFGPDSAFPNRESDSPFL
jgi:hypothetical protein